MVKHVHELIFKKMEIEKTLLEKIERFNCLFNALVTTLTVANGFDGFENFELIEFGIFFIPYSNIQMKSMGLTDSIGYFIICI
jgi:hypothetical protein